MLRNSPYPLLETFDWANPQSPHFKRDVTTTAPQALALVNSDLVLGWSQALAVVMSAFDLMKQLSMLATLAADSAGSSPSR